MPEKLIIVTGDSFSLIRDYIGGRIVLWNFPETLANGDEMIERAKNIIKSPSLGIPGPIIVTTLSLFILRELHILLCEKQDFEIEWVNVKSDEVKKGDSVDGIGNIEVLDSELRQCDRYMNCEMEQTNHYDNKAKNET